MGAKQKKRAKVAKKTPSASSLKKAILEDALQGSKLLEESNRKLLDSLTHYEEKVLALEAQLDILKKKVAKENVQGIKDENHALHLQAKKLEKHLEAKDKVQLHLQKKLDHARVERQDAKNLVKKLQKEVAEKDAAFAYLEGALRDRKDEAFIVKDVNTRLKERHTSHEAHVKKAQNILKRQSRKLTQYENIVGLLTKQVSELKNREKVLKKKILLFTEKIVHLEKSTKKGEIEKDILEKDVARLEQQSQKQQKEKRVLGREILKRKKMEETHLEEYKKLRESLDEKRKAIEDLQQALKDRRKEAQSVLELNKVLTKRDANIAEDYKSMRHVLSAKELKIQQLQKAVTLQQQDVEKQRKIVAFNSRSYRKMVDKLKGIKQHNVLLRKKAYRKQKELDAKGKLLMMQEADMNHFKEQVANLFGVNRGLEQEKIEFKDYVQKLHTLLQEKQSTLDQAVAGQKKLEEERRRRFDEQMEEVMKRNTDEIITLKAQLLDMKSKLVQREKQLQEKEHLEKLLLKDITTRLRALFDGKVNMEELEKLLQQPASTVLPPEAFMQPQQVIVQPIVQAAPSQVVQSSSVPSTVPVQQVPQYVPVMPQVAPQPNTPQPPVSSQPASFELEKKPAPTGEIRDYHPKTLPKIKLRGHDADSQSYAFMKPKEEAEYVVGTLQEEEKNDDDEFIKQALEMQDHPKLEISTNYNMGDNITPMIDIGLQRGEDIDEIRESLLNTGYDSEEVERAVTRFKQGKIGQ